MQSKFYTITKITTFVLAVIFGLMLTAQTVCLDNKSAINGYFGISTQQKVDTSDGETNSTYYSSSFTSVADVKANEEKLCAEVMEEGAVLLKNDEVSDGKALPLWRGAGVSLFSASCVWPVLCGQGSASVGGASAKGNSILLDSFKNAGLSVNEDLFNWYLANASTYCRVEGANLKSTDNGSINDAKWSDVPEDRKINADYADAAIFILSRQSGETKDLPSQTGKATDTTNGDFLVLSPTESDMLKNLCEQKKQGKFSRIIVVMNSAYQVSGFVNDEDYGIDALLWVGTLGSVGADGVARILVGEVNPSGRLTDTFFTSYDKNPASYNFGVFTYQNAATSQINYTGQNYLVYQEGIYVGYRYTETRYEDYVMGGVDKAGNFDYYATVEYPFGYGLSYSTFSYDEMSISFDKQTDVYQTSVKVTNTGAVAGKETVQIYLQKPYTDYDVNNFVEKASVELVGYAKTQLLASGESEIVKVKVDGREFASYDSFGAGTYVLDAGKYLFTAAKDAHDAVNNVLAFKGYSSGIVANGNTSNGNASLVKLAKDVQTLDTSKYSLAQATNVAIVNNFDNADLKRYGDVENAQSFDYLSRNDWVGTMPTTNVALTRTDKMNSDYAAFLGDSIVMTPDDYPAYGQDNGLQLIDLRAYADGDDDPTNDVWIEYDNPLWDTLLDQLTWDDTVALLSDGLRKTGGISSIGKPETVDHNGANGVVHTFATGANGLGSTTNDADKGQTPIAYPCNAIVAATFNDSLIKEYGEQWGEDCLWAGYNALYGPGLNIHRSQYNGRNFEYYSEDPFLTGNAVAYLTEGMTEKGVYVYLKHCLLNDQELRRNGVNTWANEQTIREIYLKPFQIAIEKGGAQCVMTSFNCIGAVWSGAQGFLNTVLRGEFGMSGHAVTDMHKQYMVRAVGVLAGNDIPDGQLAGAFDAYKTGYGELAWAMRASVHRILYTVVHSNAMNGVSASTRFVTIVPTWETTLKGATLASAIIFAASLACFVVTTTLDVVKSKKKTQTA